MPFRDILNPVCTLAACTCERSQLAARLVRNFHFRGKGRIVQRIRPRLNDPVLVASCNGIQYQLDLRDDIQRELYFNIYERQDLQCALEMVPRGSVCLDIGANNGAFALEFARKVGPEGRVFAYEPDPENFSRLITNSRLNGFEHMLQCRRVAVTNTAGQLPFYRSAPDHSGWGSLAEFRDIAVATATVEATTLDAIVAQEGLQKVALLKVDVEAHEPELLEGGSGSLAAQVFQRILIEFNGIRLAERKKTLQDFLRPLAEAGYVAVGLRTELLKKMIDRLVPPETIVSNFLFAPRSSTPGSVPY
jgi:FkbM family methyltransferase